MNDRAWSIESTRGERCDLCGSTDNVLMINCFRIERVIFICFGCIETLDLWCMGKEAYKWQEQSRKSQPTSH